MLVGRRYQTQYEEEEEYYEDGGGIVYATDATFRNNITGVYYVPYNHSNGGTFRHCNFFTDTAYFIEEPPGNLMSLYEVSKITIEGCTFENETPFNPEEGMQQRGNGIYSFESYIWVMPCGGDFCDGHYYSTFKGLNFGIKSLGTASYTLWVDSTTFENNRRGLYLSGVELSTITSNWFITNINIQEETGDTLVGLYLDHCHAYQVEDNHFENSTQPENYLVVGITANNSGTEDDKENELYNNYLEGLHVGILAQNSNRKARNGEGLRIKCNRFYDCGCDIAVTAFTGGMDMGIAREQGSAGSEADSPAGNRFSWTGPTGTPTDIDNEQEHINYYYHANAYPEYHLEPIYYTSYTVTLYPNQNSEWDTILSCPQALNGGGQPGYEEMMMQAAISADSIDLLLKTLVDAGSTGTMINNIQSANSVKAETILSELSNAAPFISDSVIEGIIENEQAFPNLYVRDVMTAASQSAKSNSLVDELLERNNPMPPLMLDQILQGRSLVSVFEQMNAERD